VIAKVPVSTKDEVDAAVAAAKEAFPKWRATPADARVSYLFKLRNLIEERAEEISRIQTMEHGKTIHESRAETRRGNQNVEFATGIPSFMMGCNSEDVEPGVDEYLIRQPLGVFGMIAPYNFPFMFPLMFLPHGIATGNCMVLKPSPLAPISQVKIAELLDEIGLPPGVWNIVHGGAEASLVMLEHPDIVGIAFVGTTKVGKDVICRKCGETGKRFIAQCGAKNFLVVMPDADVEKSVAHMMPSFFGNTGQRCLAASNLVIIGDDKFYNKFVDAIVESATKLKVGHGLDETIQVGPLKSVDGKERVIKYIEKGIEEGAKLRLDGRNPKIVGGYPDTCFVGPTIFQDATPDMTIGREEIFGPVISIMRAESFDEAIDMIHSNPYGNGASIFTSNGKLAREFQYRVQAGNIGINVGVPAPVASFPFGGMKDSFFGVLHGEGQEVIRFFTESKVVVQRWF
jgi:malonate-semialdehyde dehydrogenase (acetylating)/methylmalonate-semialdehyde dehydrogenase